MKKIITVFLFLILALQSFSLIGCQSNIVDENDDNNINITSDEITNGAYASSYAEVVENFLFEKGFKNYHYQDIENNQDGQQEFINKNIYSYINDDGELQFDNFFKILYLKGVNSIRLRLWNDPKDEKGNSYGGGHNDIDTDIWIMNQAKKYGINDFVIDFQYSDFWTDPGKQNLPKAWVGQSEDQISKNLYKYTYDTLVKFKKADLANNISSIQIGNEITAGLLWDKKPFNFDTTTKYLESGIKSLKKFNNEFNTNIKSIIHFDGSVIDKSKSLVTFMSDEFILKNLDYIGLTFYPSWNTKLDSLFNIIKLIKTIYNKNVLIMEFASIYGQEKNTRLGDNQNDQMSINDAQNIVPVSSEGELFLYDAFLNTLSKAMPNSKIGYYWWEPGWILTGRTSWATKAGIGYLKNSDKNTYKVGNTWSNKGLFDSWGHALPVLDEVENYRRIVKNKTYYDDDKFNTYSLNDVIGDEANSKSYYKEKFFRNNSLSWPVSYIKKYLSTYLNMRINPESNNSYYGWNNVIDIYNDEYDFEKLKNEDLINIIKDKYKHIMWNQVNFLKINKSENEYEISINAKKDSFYYKQDFKAPEIIIKLNETSNTLKTNYVNLESKFKFANVSDYNSLIKEIKSSWSLSDDEIKNYFYKALEINGGISEYNNENKFWLYDESKNANRDIQADFLKNDNLLRADGTINFNNLNDNIQNWPTTKNDWRNIKYLCIRKKINSDTFEKTGTESWLYPKCIIFKL